MFHSLIQSMRELECRFLAVLKEKEQEKKNYVGSETLPT